MLKAFEDGGLSFLVAGGMPPRGDVWSAPAMWPMCGSRTSAGVADVRVFIFFGDASCAIVNTILSRDRFLFVPSNGFWDKPILTRGTSTRRWCGTKALSSQLLS